MNVIHPHSQGGELDPGADSPYTFSMYLSKTPSPSNFRYLDLNDASRPGRWFRRSGSCLALRLPVGDSADEPAPVEFDPAERSDCRELDPRQFGPSLPGQRDPGSEGGEGGENAGGRRGELNLHIDDDGSFLLNRGDEKLLQSAGFGIGGADAQAWILNFRYSREYRFFGLGEKNGPLEHSGRRTSFWNTDVWGDFPMEQVIDGSPDPPYISIPWVLIRCGENGWLGIFLHTLHRSYAVLGSNPHIEIMESADVQTQFFLAADRGAAALYFFVGDRPADVIREYQLFLGTHERPPLWSLGHQQSRWGYGSRKDLEEIREQYRRYGIPNDGLWLDIDYMEGYRVFSFNRDHFPDPAEDIRALQEEGNVVVPILDPGVKRDPGYGVYDSGSAENMFCRNSLGQEYLGYVWPGETVFPDFSLPRVRRWWADRVQAMVGLGIRGFWLDMNDPSTGASDPAEMRFQEGRLPHDYFHNSYALGMQMASYQGFRQAAPDMRPFLLSRSGSPGTARFSAVWLGDNYSNRRHMAQALVSGLNLGLSGIAFWGADVPGFGGDADAQLMEDWYKAGFLYPFLRNHACSGTAPQEPWRFGPGTRKLVGRYIALRYRLLPYLYNLFIIHQQQGDPVLRPLWYEFPAEFDSCESIGDQYMAGDALMHAPLLEQGQRQRKIYLPEGFWLDALQGRWVRGGRTIKLHADREETPLFFREGRIVPTLVREPSDHRIDLRDVELHMMLRLKYKGTLEYRYICDDGQSMAYTRGNQTEILIKAMVRGDDLEVYLEHQLQGYGPLRISIVLYDEFESVVLHSSSARIHGKKISLKKKTRGFGGGDIDVRVSKSLRFALG